MKSSIFLALIFLCSHSFSGDRSDYLSCADRFAQLHEDVVRYGNVFVSGKEIYSHAGFVDWVYEEHESDLACVEDLGVRKNVCSGNYYSPSYDLDEAESILLLSLKYMASTYEYYRDLRFTRVFYDHERFSEKFEDIYLSEKVSRAKEIIKSVRSKAPCLFPEDQR